MKLTKIQDKLSDSIFNLVHSKCYNKTSFSTSSDIHRKINNEIFLPNGESIQDMQIIILDNLQDEIN